ncbi:MAG: amino acid ABC transporter substrate-binding protein [Alphaproteobacteria bacterium]|jgi:general L-amino acid transport system substrate-binding protein|nr:amino acid ABC transporter substrate-binding protein [Alphaproteobacteria bacterium]MBU2042680.1 amino acid ABC transporter substrate-binding protein [Alphaproteobacteria bacterium]MBU2124662.1 amino acid ABC transporter substrate-binding protein [Alphaproteobacteria bacterium]MBU2207481.1 amino acid ABC transporter substrate-binding protein [Alphaproteobacteria bacterium]MBU2292128.1 amino acid ABC transporter substrate-binding protein [Alphaproteobacteria bacterium]
MRTRSVGQGTAAGVAASLLLVLAVAACGRGERPIDADDGADPVAQAQTAAPGFASPTLAAIKRRGRLNCGVHEGLVGFAYTDNRGDWRGFDADFCRALAAAVLGNANAVRFVPLTGSQRFEALRSGRIDVLWRSTSWTLTREAKEGVRFAGVNYYDGQGFLVRRALDLASAAELNGARVCVQRGSTSELNVADWFRERGLEYTPVVSANEEAARAAYAREDCDAFSADVSALAAARTTLSNPEQHTILPDVISKEPLGPAVKRGDEAWTSVVRWTLNALILAEELGVTRDNAEEMASQSRNATVRRLLGREGEVGQMLGLRNDWAKAAIEAQGNYGEIFARNVGPDSPLDLARGLNAQWNATPGGLIYALPIR